MRVVGLVAGDELLEGLRNSHLSHFHLVALDNAEPEDDSKGQLDFVWAGRPPSFSRYDSQAL